jgi:threonine synthase
MLKKTCKASNEYRCAIRLQRSRVQKRPTPFIGLRCTNCHRSFEENRPLGRCPACNGLLDTVFDEDIIAEYPVRKPANDDRSMWRFSMFLPIGPKTHLMSAGEGNTPLRRVRSFAKNVWAKDETRNPTGTFKDRGASVALTHLSELKVRRIVLASEGNAGCSFALYSRMSGMDCLVYLPKKANPGKIQLTRRLGAKVTQVGSTISDAGHYAAKTAKQTGRYNASTFVTPFRHDGKGTMAVEICEQLEWQCPHYIVYPVGGGVGLVGMWKMFKLLQRIGWTKTRPRIVAVQPTGCAPIVDAFNHRMEDVEEWQSPNTIANGLKIPKPLAGKWILKSLRESRGIGLKVSDSEIRKTVRSLASKEGMLLEPSSASAFAALPRLYETGQLERSERVVVIATGSALKTMEQL